MMLNERISRNGFALGDVPAPKTFNFTAADSHSSINVHVGDTMIVTLPFVPPATGFQWKPIYGAQTTDDPWSFGGVVHVQAIEYADPLKIVLVATKPGSAQVYFEQRNAYGDPSGARFALDVNVTSAEAPLSTEPKPNGASEQRQKLVTGAIVGVAGATVIGGIIYAATRGKKRRRRRS